MRSWVILVAMWSGAACGKTEPAPSAGSGSAPPPAPVAQADAAAGSAAPIGSGSGTASPAADDGAAEVADLVVAAVASVALGKQEIEASCVAVTIIPAGDWTVAAARLKDCGDKTARSILWLFKRPRNGRWSEDFAGQPPKCWKGVPPDIAGAVAKASKIPTC
jgi:hypothetical protein